MISCNNVRGLSVVYVWTSLLLARVARQVVRANFYMVSLLKRSGGPRAQLRGL